jgi:hypothetical protein
MLVLRAVPKRLRARFNALESVKSFGWSGSAAAGGCALIISSARCASGLQR